MDQQFSPIQKDSISKEQIEMQVQQQKELTYLGSFARTRTHKLYFYNTVTQEIKESAIAKSNTIHLLPRGGKLVAVDLEQEKAMVDPRNIYFEALNYTNAIKKVAKWKAGKANLFNLKPYREATTIDFFKPYSN